MDAIEIALPDGILDGDCVDEMARLPACSVDLVFADPPYNLQLSQELHRPDNSRVDGVEADWDKFADFAEYDRFTRAWLGECRRLVHFDRTHLEEWFAESLVNGDEGRGQTARAFEELPAADPELFGSGIGQLLDPVLDVLLLPRLRMRHILAVGDHPGWNRGLKRLGFRRHGALCEEE